jgi:flagellar hook protein FlgE
LRELIRKEMPQASASDLDVWVRKFQGMPLNSVRTMLEMRRLVPIRPRPNEGNPLTAEPIPAPDMPAVVGPNPPRLAPVPTSQPSPWGPSLAALRQARNVILNNIANAGTPGFKRCRAVLGELGQSGSVSDPGGVRIAAVQRDWSPGKLINTRRKLDFAIDGDGFFMLRRGTRRALTRNGNFERDSRGELVLATERRWRVETTAEPGDFKSPQGSGARKHRNKVTLSLALRTAPARESRGKRPLEIPILPGALAPFARAGMAVEIQRGGKTPAPRPAAAPGFELRLATVPNPDGLEPLGEGLFAATPASGQPTIQPSKSVPAGAIRSGFLEASNVSTKRELAELRTITGQMRALHTAAGVINSEPESGPPAPIVEKPGLRRMSDYRRPDCGIDFEVWFDRFFHSAKYREIKRNLGYYDREPEDSPAAAKPQPMVPAPRPNPTRNPVTPAGFEELDSWEFPVEIEILFHRRLSRDTAGRRMAG